MITATDMFCGAGRSSTRLAAAGYESRRRGEPLGHRHLRSRCKAQVHAVLAKCGVYVPMTDLFGLEGTELLDRLKVPAPYAARISSLRRIFAALQFEIDTFSNLVQGDLARDAGYRAVQTIPGSGPCRAPYSSSKSATSAGSPAPARTVLHFRCSAARRRRQGPRRPRGRAPPEP